jgi:hypothetical protein
VSNKPLALVVALTGADFVLWNVALGANNVVLALVAGLTLPPLVAACTLMLVLTAARLVSRIRAPGIPAVQRQRASRRKPSTTARPALRHTQPETPTAAIRTARARGAHAAPDYDTAPATTATKNPSPSRGRKLAA